MTADIPTLIDEAKQTQGYSEGDLRSLVKSLAAALEAQSSELAQMNDRIDVLAEERARRYHEGACRYQIERDAARAAIRQALVAWHRGMTLGDTQYIVNDQTIDLTMTDIWDALSRAIQEGGN